MKIIFEENELKEIINKHLYEVYGISSENVEDILIKEGCMIIVNYKE